MTTGTSLQYNAVVKKKISHTYTHTHTDNARCFMEWRHMVSLESFDFYCVVFDNDIVANKEISCSDVCSGDLIGHRLQLLSSAHG